MTSWGGARRRGGWAVVGVLAAAALARATPIVDPTFFDRPGDVRIDFESVPGVATTPPPSGTRVTTEYASLGVLLRSEASPDASQATDPDDSTGRFGEAMVVLGAVSGGGRPHSGVRYAAGKVYTNLNVSDMRFDFTLPVQAVGMWVIDNDFSTARLQAFDAGGTLLETLIVPQVPEGGETFAGMARSAPEIAYLILDGAGGAALDSTFIDDLSFRPAVAVVPEPLPQTLTALGVACLACLAARGARGRL